MKNIIVSKATPNGISSICVIRVSGDNVLKVISPLIKKKIRVQTVEHVSLYDLNKKFIDYAIILYFKSPKSLTGEDLIEFHIHGSEKISKKLINELIFLGARLAKPGEFLERRYLNGKISLIDCEMINNKIYFNNENMFNLTTNSQNNLFSCIIKNSKFKINILLICLQTIKLLDKNPLYEDFIFIKLFFKKFKKFLNILLKKIKNINYLKNNFEIMIMGKRNVGKSTLFNKIAMNYDSIVTNIPGTTKNNITKTLYFSSKSTILNDTAGLKLKTKNLIEKIGIIKNVNKIYKGNLILYLVDKFNLKEIFYNMPINFLKKIKSKEIIIIVNKCDIFGKKEGIFKLKSLVLIILSAKNSVLIHRLKCFISKIIDNEKLLKNNKMSYSNVSLLFNNCKLFYKEFCCSYDILISKTINFQKKIFKLTGNYTNKNITNSFFNNFCLGK